MRALETGHPGDGCPKPRQAMELGKTAPECLLWSPAAVSCYQSPRDSAFEKLPTIDSLSGVRSYLPKMLLFLAIAARGRVLFEKCTAGQAAYFLKARRHVKFGAALSGTGRSGRRARRKGQTDSFVLVDLAQTVVDIEGGLSRGNSLA
jgi:hypothetical protein